MTIQNGLIISLNGVAVSVEFAINLANRGFSRHCAHSVAQVVTTMVAMLDIFLCSITRKRIAEKNPTWRMP